MSDFSQRQTRALRRKLDRSHVQSREVEGRSIDYIEGWFAIAQANAIFGFGGWDRETTHCERLFERTGRDSTGCGYVVRVRIRVRAGDAVISREGTGWGSATAAHVGEAHERALKAAETERSRLPKPMRQSGHWRRSGTALGLLSMTRSKTGSRRRSPNVDFFLSMPHHKACRSPIVSPPRHSAAGCAN